MIVKPDDIRIIEYIKNAGIVARTRGNNAGKKQFYKDIVTAFDIETTSTIHQGKKINFMYSWAWQLDDEYTVIGRTWDEFISLKQDLISILEGATICVFVHNLKYEFQYLRPLGFNSEDVLCSDPREVIKAFSEPFEFRCTYRLTGVSLDKFTENVKHKKLSGEEFDYTKFRTPKTELTDKELEYIVNDVWGLVEAVKQRNAYFKDTIYSMPITLTGYIRRTTRRAMRTYNINQRERIKIDEDTYKLLAGCFRGGNAYANRYSTGEILSNVYHYDISSAYTSQMIKKPYPIANWQVVNNPSMDKFLRYIYTRGRAVIARIRINNIRLLKVDNPCPYISSSKCIIRGKNRNAFNRLLFAEQVELFVTDIDFKIIMKQYEFDEIEVLEMQKNRYGYLPGQLTEILRDLYYKKTELKGVDDIEYKISKEQLNSVFGMTAQNPAKEICQYVDGKFIFSNAGAAAQIEKHNKGAFLSYAWGVYTAAYCRYELQEFIDIVGDDFVYCDTDGIYYLNHDIHKDEIDKLIKQKEDEADKIGLYAIDNDGVIHYGGAWEPDETIKRFVALGQKKYAWEDKKGLHIATAGVHKENGGKELGKIENYKEGFTFKLAGGNEAFYMDEDLGYITIKGERIRLTPFVYIAPREYTLGEYQEYKNLMLYPSLWLEWSQDRGHNKKEYLFKEN